MPSCSFVISLWTFRTILNSVLWSLMQKSECLLEKDPNTSSVGLWNLGSSAGDLVPRLWFADWIGSWNLKSLQILNISGSEKKGKKPAILLQENLMRVFLSVPPPKAKGFLINNSAKHKSAETRKSLRLVWFQLLSGLQHEVWPQKNSHATFIHGVFDS